MRRHFQRLKGALKRVPYGLLAFGVLLALVEGFKVVAGFDGFPNIYQVTFLTLAMYFTFVVVVIAAPSLQKKSWQWRAV